MCKLEIPLPFVTDGNDSERGMMNDRIGSLGGDGDGCGMLKVGARLWQVFYEGDREIAEASTFHPAQNVTKLSFSRTLQKSQFRSVSFVGALPFPCFPAWLLRSLGS